MLVLSVHSYADDVEIADILGVIPVEVSIALRRLETLGVIARQAPKENE